mgnify:CR=1 FL=1
MVIVLLFLNYGDNHLIVGLVLYLVHHIWEHINFDNFQFLNNYQDNNRFLVYIVNEEFPFEQMFVVLVVEDELVLNL